MAGIVGAVGVIIAGVTALMAFGDDAVRNSFAHPFIENKIFADEF